MRTVFVVITTVADDYHTVEKVCSTLKQAKRVVPDIPFDAWEAPFDSTKIYLEHQDGNGHYISIEEVEFES